jgi:hypothetical protein
VAAGNGSVINVVAAHEPVQPYAVIAAELAVRGHVFVRWTFGFVVLAFNFGRQFFDFIPETVTHFGLLPARYLVEHQSLR